MFQMTLTFVDTAEAQYYLDAIHDIKMRQTTSWNDTKDLAVLEDKMLAAYEQEGGTSYAFND